MGGLKKIRLLDKRISQFELARKSGVHPSRISRLEAGLASPSIKEAWQISEALGMLPEEVFGLGAVVERLTASREKKAG